MLSWRGRSTMGTWMTEAARSPDQYSNSMFVIEVDWTATAVFEAKWRLT
jgi:hypothetical protein